MIEDRPGIPVVAVIPAYNESERLPSTVAGLRRAGIDRIVVVDDGSDDDTAEVGARCGARVVRLPRRRGKGRALSAGVLAAGSCEAVALVDADVGESASEMTTLVKVVLEGEADLVIGVLPPGLSGGWGLVQAVAGAGLFMLTSRRFRAPLSGQRAIRGAILAKLLPFQAGFGAEVAMTVQAIRGGLRIREVDVAMTHRRWGRSVRGIFHRGLQLAHIARALGASARIRGR